MDQQERLDYLVERFKEDSGEYRDLKTPADTEGKKRILRSLMNIRMPKMMAPSPDSPLMAALYLMPSGEVYTSALLVFSVSAL